LDGIKKRNGFRGTQPVEPVTLGDRAIDSDIDIDC
jgi:hypothetical protein